MTSPFPPGAGGRRPLPRDLEARLTGEADDADLVHALRRADRPRFISADLQARLEASLAGPPRPLPHRLQRRLRRHLTVPADRSLGVAATLLVVLGLAALLALGPGSGGRDGADEVTAGAPGSGAPTGPGTPRAPAGGDTDPGAGGPGDRSVDGGERPAPGPGEPGAVPGAAPDGGPASAPAGGHATGGHGPAPPFGFEHGGPDEVAVAPAGPTTTTTPAGPPVRVGVTGTGGDVEAGFRSYVALLNAAGGAGGRPVELVEVAADRPDDEVLAVVNLGPATVAGAGGPPGWVTGALLEAPAAPEAVLRGRVFSFSSVLERQAHLAVLAAFPEPAPGARAVVYVGGAEPWSGRVPAALERALRAQQVVPVRAVFDPASPVRPTGDAAFLSVPGEAARSYLAAGGAGTPPRGTWGVASLFDESLLDVAEGVRVASPFAPASGQEVDALREGAGRPVSSGTVHGWVTAKALAVAIWQSGAATADELLVALEGLAGWDTGFLPPYEVRPGTRSRTPEAVVLEVRQGVFAQVGGFRRDPL